MPAKYFLLIATANLALAADLTISPNGVTLIPKSQNSYTAVDKEVTFTAKLKGKDVMPKDLTCTFKPSPVGSWEPAKSYNSATATLSAPDKLDDGVSQIQVTMQCSSGGSMADPVTITVALLKNSEWESRAIAGYHQAGASSASFTQNFFMDFLVMRGLGSGERVYQNKWNLWGDVRIASAPQQVTTSIAEFAAAFATQAGQVKVNELAMSAEYQSGMERQIKKFDQGSRIRTVGVVGFGGATGFFEPPAARGETFVVPAPSSQKYALFQQRFPQVVAAGAPFVAFLPPDRQRFYRFYGAGLRLTTYEKDKPYAPPATWTVTIGQDELTSGGLFRGVVSRVDAFYPLPLSAKDGKWKFLFLFGTVNQWWHKDRNETQLVLQTAQENNAAVPISDPRVAIVTVRNTRDTYRIGFGIDLVNLLNSWLKQ